jgi:hypothetical protein
MSSICAPSFTVTLDVCEGLPATEMRVRPEFVSNTVGPVYCFCAVPMVMTNGPCFVNPPVPPVTWPVQLNAPCVVIVPVEFEA